MSAPEDAANSMILFDAMISIPAPAAMLLATEASLDALGRVALWGTLLMGMVWGVSRFASSAESRDWRRTALLTMALGGVVLAGAARTLPLIYLGLFTVSAALHIAAALQHDGFDRSSVRASYLFHSSSLLLLLLGLIVLYGLGESVDITAIEAAGRALSGSSISVPPPSAAIVSAVAAVAGLCGYAALHALPRHRGGWLGNAMSPDTPLLLLAPLGAGLLALLRVVPVPLGLRTETVSTAVVLASWLLMLAGSSGALVQARVVALLRWAGLFHFGLWLVGAAVGAWEASHAALSLPAASGLPGGCSAALYALCADAIALLGLAAALAAVKRGNANVEFIEDVAGLARRQPLAGAAAAVCLCSLCGIPPLPGFWARWWLLTAAWSAQQPSSLTGLYEPHYGFLATGAVLLAASAAMATVYLRLFQRILLDEPRGRLDTVGVARWAAGLLSAFVVALGLWPQPLLQLSIRAFPAQVVEEPPAVEVEHPESDGAPDAIPGPYPSASSPFAPRKYAGRTSNAIPGPYPSA
jgi:NADH-quinone oxidoreductase subunit N